MFGFVLYAVRFLIELWHQCIVIRRRQYRAKTKVIGTKVVLAHMWVVVGMVGFCHRFLDGEEVGLLAEWVWSSFHPGKRIDVATRYYLLFHMLTHLSTPKRLQRCGHH